MSREAEADSESEQRGAGGLSWWLGSAPSVRAGNTEGMRSPDRKAPHSSHARIPPLPMNLPPLTFPPQDPSWDRVGSTGDRGQGAGLAAHRKCLRGPSKKL